MIHIYQTICGLLAVLVIGAILRSKRMSDRLTGATLLIVLLLRLFLVK